MKVRGFITHKLAEKYSDCQDFLGVNTSKKILAIADGMSQSIFPQWWAEELVLAATEGNWTPKQDDVSKLQQKWFERVSQRIEQLKQDGRNPWRLENCITEKTGAGATLCVLRILENYHWECYVLGDSSLISINQENNITRIYRSQEGKFTNHPDFFDSFGEGKGEVKHFDGVFSEGCKLILVTDALAELLYEKHSQQDESDYIDCLTHIESHEDFVDLVDRWRKSDGMTNDDTTLVVIDFDGKDELEINHWDDLSKLIENEIKKSLIMKESNTGERTNLPQQRIEMLIEKIISCINELIDEIGKMGKGRSKLKKLLKSMEKTIKKIRGLCQH